MHVKIFRPALTAGHFFQARPLAQRDNIDPTQPVVEGN